MTQVRRCRSFLSGLLALALWTLPVELRAQDVRISLESVITSGLNLPLYITHAHEGTNRRFIVEQPGIISVMQPGSSSRTTFLDIRTRVLSGGERGLLGLAFHPQFGSNGRFFVDYTRQPDGATVIAEYRVSPANPNAAGNTENVLLLIPQPYENHNGGMIEFGPDGYLYIGMGDGGSANDPQNRAQNINELLGKILRIDVDSPVPPPSNPYAGSIPGRDEIYAIGMRNPWRFSFDRATGQLYAGDVGQNDREEVDIVTAGGNYGWRIIEGTRCTGFGPVSCSNPGFIPPIVEYDHSTNGRCSITGGYVYRGSKQSLPLGAYIYGDYCSGEIFMFQGGVQTILLDTAFNISSFGEDQDGELYVVNLGGGIYRILNPNAAMQSTTPFSIADRGSTAFVSEGILNPASGYARIQVESSSALPSGMTIFTKRRDGVVVSEASFPAMPLISSGRIFVDLSPIVKTGVAFANPNDTPVTIQFYFTDASGNNFGGGSTAVAAKSQIATFLEQPPFNQPSASGSSATFSFAASQLLSVIALRGIVDPRTEFLMSALPVIRLSGPPVGVQTIPDIVWGGGWNTGIELVNPTDSAIAGSIQVFDPSGQRISLMPPVESYSIPPRSSLGFSAFALGQRPLGLLPLQAGSLRITPTEGSASPSAAAIFTLAADGVITVSEGGFTAIPTGTAFRMFVENLGTGFSAGAIHTGIALANPTSAAVSVTLEVFAANGASTGLSGTISIPANGQNAVFLNQVPGLEGLPGRFQGVLRLTAGSPIAVTGLRGHYNERGQFLFWATAAVAENDAPNTTELMFPHIVTGGGYDTQFVLFSSRTQSSNGTVYYFDPAGNVWSVPTR